MSNYICWLCQTKESRKSDLKNHMVSIHDRFKIICPWCFGKELTFRKPIDLKTHVKANHKQTRWDAPDDCFGEPNSFWLSVHPKDYLRLINPTKYDSPEAKFMRKAVEKWIGKLGGKSSRNLAQWKEGWGAVPLLSPSPSPCLDFEESERRMYIHSISLEGNVRATTYEEGKIDTTWFRVEIANSIMDSPRLKESLVRKLLKIRRFQGEEPQTFGQKLNGTNFIMYQTQISLLLGLDDRSIVSICKTVCPKYGPPPTKKFNFSSEITKPVVVHDGRSSKENVSSTQSKEKPSSLASPASRVSESPEIRFPLDYLLPIKKLNKCHELTYQNSAANPNECPSASSTHHRDSQDEPARPPAVPAPESTSMLPIVPVSIPADPPATISIAARPDDCPPASLSHRRESPDEPARPPAVSAPESTSMLPIVSVSVPGDPPATISIAARPDDDPPAS